MKLPSTMEVLSPLTHTEVSLGTDAKFRRLKFIGPDGRPFHVPVVSGNSIRGLLRRCAARTIIDVCGIEPRSLSVTAFDLLHSGGGIAAGSTSGVAFPVDELRQARATLPPLALFGGAVHGHILQGQVMVDMAVPICQETAPWTGEESGVSLWDLVQEIPYTHRDDRDDRDEKSNVQMRYSVECLVPGTRLRHGAHLTTDDEVAVGCWWDAVARLAGERRVGGMGAVGHGAFSWTWQAPDGAVDRYRGFLADNQDQIRMWLAALS